MAARLEFAAGGVHLLTILSLKGMVYMAVVNNAKAEAVLFRGMHNHFGANLCIRKK